MSYKNLLLEKEEGLAILYINRPDAMNALNYEVLRELKIALSKISADDEIKALIITGTGDKAFVAGADISYMQPLHPGEGKEFSQFGQEIFLTIENLEKPVIAAINGFALGGGCELALTADMRLAAENARFGQPEVGLGIIPGFGGTQRLPRLVGEAIAKEIIFTGSMINAEEAYRIGLVNHVYPQEALLDEAKKLAHKIMGNAPMAVALSKTAINKGMQTDINSAMIIETGLFGLCFSTADQKHGMSAFINKEKPNFKGE
ncbi:MAG TPA: short-chain-enoyl-CoA hydratase [Syntrophomonadaceae bacterium]|nr:short-chain-enoyl-CoA hydratase [Syntrophomonadaceae bacterium]